MKTPRSLAMRVLNAEINNKIANGIRDLYYNAIDPVKYIRISCDQIQRESRYGFLPKSSRILRDIKK